MSNTVTVVRLIEKATEIVALADNIEDTFGSDKNGEDVYLRIAIAAGLNDAYERGKAGKAL